ncbi:MAG: M48 family metallopeptidase [Burkholderiales bacterium]|nr:M48 family metallopeptidase [Burkholderiales bacterium]
MPSVAPAPVQMSLFDVEPAAAPGATAAAPAGPASTRSVAPVLPSPPTPPSAARLPAREIRFGEHRVSYALRRARRRSIGFLVGPEGLTVSAPRWVGLAEIESALREKSLWILRKLREQRERARRLEAARVDWRDGAAIPFLGEPVIMLLDPRVGGSVLHSAEGTLPGVPRLTLHLGLPQDAAPEQIRDAVQGWLQRQARRIFEERVSVFAPRLGVRVRRLALSAAATRWGSASADGSIRLNWRLVHFGMPVIDYVVTHELAHLLEMNHSPAFWEAVRAALPGFEAARGALRSEVLPVFE